MKKLLSLCLLLLTTIAGWAEKEFTVGNFKYTVTDDVNHYVSVAQNGDNQPTGAITIPSRVIYETVTYAVTSVGASGFSGTGITSVTIPASVLTIGDYAFQNCNSMTSIRIEDSGTALTMAGTYWERPLANNATTIYIGRNLTLTGEENNPLKGEENNPLNDVATSVEFGPQVTTINPKLFYSNTKLESITIGSGVTTIGEEAFYDCGGDEGVTETVVRMGSNVTTIGASAFRGCEKMKSVTLPSTLTTIGNNAFNSTGLTSISIPASVTSVGDAAFQGCSSMTSIRIEDSGTVLPMAGTYFERPLANNATTIYVGRNLTLTGEDVTYQLLDNVTSVEFGPQVTAIPNYLFSVVTLSSVKVPWLTPVTLNAETFSAETYANATLNVPAGTKTDYAAADGWKNFEHVAHWSTLVTLTASNHGSIVTEEATASNGTEQYRQPKNDAIIYTLNADTGYELTALTDNAAAVSPLPALGEAQTRTNTSGEEFVALNATFSAISYTLGYELAGGSVASDNPTTYTIESTAITLNNPTREGYTFTGWTGTGLDAATTTVTIAAGSTGNRSYTATWTPTVYNIVYTDGGTATPANPTTYTIETPTFTLTNPTKTGYTFKGWKLNGEGDAMMTVTITQGSTGHLAYTATWQVNQYTITFDSNGGTEIDAIKQDYATAVVAPANPTREGYTFAGWDKDIPTTIPAENVTITATWTPVNYTISYDLAGGSVASANPTSYNIESAPITLINPTKDGYDFAGWTGTGLDAATKTVIIATGNTGNRSYTATWTKKTYSVSITGGGVTADNYSPEDGDDVVLTIMDDPDATLTSLTVNGSEVKGSIVDNHYTITSVSGNVSVVATWSSTKEFITLATSTATFSCGQDLNFTGSELKAYIAAGYSKSGNGVLLVRVYDVPANTGLVIRGEVGPTYKIPYSTSQSYFVNLLKAHRTDEDVPATSDDENYYNYVLKRVEDVYSWHRPGSGVDMKLGAKMAYLQLPKSFMTAAAARELNLVFEDDSTTDISEFILLNNGKTGNRIYNLNGQQVDNMRKGVYIVNGRKVMK